MAYIKRREHISDSILIEPYQRLQSVVKVSEETGVPATTVHRRLKKLGLTNESNDNKRYESLVEKSLIHFDKLRQELVEKYDYKFPDVPPVRWMNTMYLVYSDGRVFYEKKNRFLSFHFGSKKRYLVYLFRINNKYVYKPAHRLIAECYIPNPNNYPLVRHLNDDESDNRHSNLAWGTPSDNSRDAFNNGVFKNRSGPTGERHNCSILTEKIVLEIRSDYCSGLSYKKVANKYNITISHAYNIIKRNAWRHI